MSNDEWAFALFGEHGAPNLDDLSVDPMDLEIAMNVFRKLAEYARMKNLAMRQRLLGKVQAALMCEQRLQDLYEALPEWARW